MRMPVDKNLVLHYYYVYAINKIKIRLKRFAMYKRASLFYTKMSGEYNFF